VPKEFKEFRVLLAQLPVLKEFKVLKVFKVLQEHL
jgi:hypothetical protein